MGEILFSSPPAPTLILQTEQRKDNLSGGDEVHYGGDNSRMMVMSNEGSSDNYSSSLMNKEPSGGTTLVPTTNTTITTATPTYHPRNTPSPTRLRDRQRKVEMTLQHIQNNPEDKVKRHHYNPDSHYPVSVPYVPKMPHSHPHHHHHPHGHHGGGGGGVVEGTEEVRPHQFHHPHHGSWISSSPGIIPPLKEADELGEVSSLKEEEEEEEEENSIPPTTNTCINSSNTNEVLEDNRKLIGGSSSSGVSTIPSTASLISSSFNSPYTSSLCNNWILETMREEIRLENERMEDATKSLMMEDDESWKTTSKIKKHSVTEPLPSSSGSSSYSNGGGIGELEKTMKSLGIEAPPKNGVPTSLPIVSRCNGGGGGTNGTGNGNGIAPAIRPNHLGERAHSYTSPSGSPLITPPFRNTRSFSLKQQSSTDSVSSEGSEVGFEGLKRAMSCDSVCSDSSVGGGDLPPPQPTGYLCIGLEYDCETADLLVHVIEAKELVGPDPNSPVPFDSYVRVYLLPDKTTNMQTRVYRKSLNPVYREKFMFGVETMEMPLRTLVFYLYVTDKRSNTLVGEAELKLGNLDIHQPLTTWLQLTDTAGQRGGESGEILISLSYLPTAERLTVVVVKARNLKFPHENKGLGPDPFVKVYLLQKGNKVSKKKSSTKRGEKTPIFNEAMIFSVPPHALQTIQLRITVADMVGGRSDRGSSIGHVIIGSSATGKPLSHWNQMLSSLRKPIAMWHLLRK